MEQGQHDLYQNTVIAHSQQPQNYRIPDRYSHRAQGYNPVCGDEITVYARVKDNQFLDLSFSGQSCAVCKCSASLMTAALINRDIASFRKVFEQFERLLKQALDPDKDAHDLGALTVFKGIWKYPSRAKCANLGWYALEAALNDKETVSTE